MKKKVFMFFILCFAMMLASCTNGSGVPTNRATDALSDEVIAKYGLASLTSSITEIDSTDINRYEIYSAADVKSSLLVYSKDVSNSLKEHGQSQLKIAASALSFGLEAAENDSYSYSTKFNSDEITKILSILNEKKTENDSEYIFVTKLIGDLSFDYYDKTNPTNYKLNSAVNLSADTAVLAYNDSKTVYFTQVLLPLRVKRFYQSSCVLESYIFVPVYACFNVVDNGTKMEIKADADSYKLTAIDFGKADTEFKFLPSSLLLVTGKEKNPAVNK